MPPFFFKHRQRLPVFLWACMERDEREILSPKAVNVTLPAEVAVAVVLFTLPVSKAKERVESQSSSHGKPSLFFFIYIVSFHQSYKDFSSSLPASAISLSIHPGIWQAACFQAVNRGEMGGMGGSCMHMQRMQSHVWRRGIT